MKVVVQRVSRASVTVDDHITGSIGLGLLLLIGIGENDTEKDLDWVCKKITRLRIFEDESGKMNRSVLDVDGNILAVSQFTLYGDVRKGNRPSFVSAASPDKAEALYEKFIGQIELIMDKKVEKGIFGAMMNVELINSGPVTIIVES